MRPVMLLVVLLARMPHLSFTAKEDSAVLLARMPHLIVEEFAAAADTQVASPPLAETQLPQPTAADTQLLRVVVAASGMPVRSAQPEAGTRMRHRRRRRASQKATKSKGTTTTTTAICGTSRYGNGSWWNSGNDCVFPFTYEGVTFNRCTFLDHPTPWCVTENTDSAKWVRSVLNTWVKRNETKRLDYTAVFEFGQCDTLCGSEPSAQAAQVRPSTRPSTHGELAAACLRHIDQCLWAKKTYRLSDADIRSEMKCMTKFCHLSRNPPGKCRSKLTQFASQMSYAWSAKNSPMSGFCHKVADWEFERHNELLEVANDTNDGPAPQAEAILHLEQQLQQRTSKQQDIDEDSLETSMNGKCLR